MILVTYYGYGRRGLREAKSKFAISNRYGNYLKYSDFLSLVMVWILGKNKK
jgi:hypothetical protein